MATKGNIVIEVLYSMMGLSTKAVLGKTRRPGDYFQLGVLWIGIAVTVYIHGGEKLKKTDMALTLQEQNKKAVAHLLKGMMQSSRSVDEVRD
jgi:hypothetical protein